MKHAKKGHLINGLAYHRILMLGNRSKKAWTNLMGHETPQVLHNCHEHDRIFDQEELLV